VNLTATLTRVDGVETTAQLASAALTGDTVLDVDDATGWIPGTALLDDELTTLTVTDVDIEADTLTVEALTADLPADAGLVLLGEDGKPAAYLAATVTPDGEDSPPLMAVLEPGAELGFAEADYDPGVPVEIAPAIGRAGLIAPGGYVVVRRLDVASNVDGGVVWNPHSYRTANTATIPAGAWTAVTSWADVETDGIAYSTGSWTIETAGWYAIAAWLTWDFNATNRRRIRVLVNGVVQRTAVVPADPDIDTYSELNIEARLTEADVVTVQGFQGSGAGLQITGGAFSVHRISV
jgi:hypothetical protein